MKIHRIILNQTLKDEDEDEIWVNSSGYDYDEDEVTDEG